MVYRRQNQSESTAAKISFSLKAKKFYEDWLQQHPYKPEKEKLQFPNQWVKKG